MARTNLKAQITPVFTHEGAPAYPHMTPEQALRRSVLSCLLWEDEFYEDGLSITERIRSLSAAVPLPTLQALAVEARSKFNLRHVPLLLLTCMVKRGAGDPRVGQTIAEVIQRADELSELLALYWSDTSNKKMIPAQLRKGLDKAFRKFDEYRLAKYDRDNKVKLRDVLRMVRPKPENEQQAALWKRVKERTLQTPDTWEVELSAGKDKGEVFTRLLTERKLGYLALLRNLRNMAQAGVDEKLVTEAIIARKGGADRVLPFRYTAAARACPQFEPALDQALVESINDNTDTHLGGKTIVLVDVSGSMRWRLSTKSDLIRMDAAATLASVIPGNTRVFSFSNETIEVPSRKGMAGVDAIIRSQQHAGTDLGGAVERANMFKHDRLIVITDEQSQSFVPDPVAEKAYMINVASNQNGVGYGKWVHIDGFSEQVLRFIAEYEVARE